MKHWLSLINTLALPRPLKIEVSTSLHLPAFLLVGLASREVAESRERVRAAMEASGLAFPRKRVVVNLSPASIPKQGTGIDLAIALAIAQSSEMASEMASVTASEKMSQSESSPTRLDFAWGELGLRGEVRSCGHLLRAYSAACQAKADRFFFPKDDEEEMIQLRERFGEALGKDPLPIPIAVQTLREAGERARAETISTVTGPSVSRFRALERKSPPPPFTLGHLPAEWEDWAGCAMVGGHSVLLLGPKGAGKTHTLEWLASLLPLPPGEMRLTQALLGELLPRAPEHALRKVGPQVRPAALLGSFRAGRLFPGELSLAHGGALIADEFPEWARDSREALRGPLERGLLEITQAGARETLPCRFQILASGNLCACGNDGARPQLRSSRHDRGAATCRCTPTQKDLYLARLSEPILDRIDLVQIFETRNRSGRKTELETPGQQLVRLRARVTSARARLIARWGGLPAEWDATQVSQVESELLSSAQTDPPPLEWRSRRRLIRVCASLCAWKGKDQPGPQEHAQLRRWLKRNIRGAEGLTPAPTPPLLAPFNAIRYDTWR